MKYLLVRCHGGLGNRIRALAAARRVSRLLGRRLLLHWPIDPHHIVCHYGALFETPHFEVCDSFPAMARLPTRHHWVGKSPTFVDPGLAEDVALVWEQNFFWVRGDEGVVWGQYGPEGVKDPVVRSELLAEFDALRPAPAVRREVEAFSRGMGGDVVGVHVRRGDNAWSNANCPDGEFFRALDPLVERSPSASLLLATDGDESPFRARYGGRVLSYRVRSADPRASPGAAVDALTTLLLLSRTRLIVRSSSSTFSQCASWFGRVPTLDVGPHEHAS